MPMCSASGLADYFHFALRAEDIGIAKPDARLFQEALQRGGVDASAAVHIGDHPGDDIAGAQQAGLRAVWFNPAGKVWEGDKLPDAQIRSLTELPPLLQKLAVSGRGLASPTLADGEP